MRNAIALMMLGALAACGQTGKLYLPDAASDVVTRPAATPAPAPEQTDAASSPQTPDSQPAAPTPAPEVTAPESKKESKKEVPKKDLGTSPPPSR